MWRAFSLIETLFTTIILVVAFYFISPVFYSIKETQIINNETDKISSFISSLINESRYQKISYSLFLSHKNNQFCFIAVEKETERLPVACDCFLLNSCQLKHYRTYFSGQYPYQLDSQAFYPKAFMTIDKMTGGMEEKCLGIKLNQEIRLLLFKEKGMIYADKPQKYNAKSQCNF